MPPARSPWACRCHRPRFWSTAAPLAALELPLRVLLRENDQGQVSMLFHPMAPVLRQAGVPEAMANRLDRAQLMLVEALS